MIFPSCPYGARSWDLQSGRHCSSRYRCSCSPNNYFSEKKKALAEYRQRATEHSRRREERWLTGTDDAQPAQATQEEMRELAEFTTLGTMFSRIEQMRVVPLDLRSF